MFSMTSWTAHHAVVDTKLIWVVLCRECCEPISILLFWGFCQYLLHEDMIGFLEAAAKPLAAYSSPPYLDDFPDCRSYQKASSIYSRTSSSHSAWRLGHVGPSNAVGNNNGFLIRSAIEFSNYYAVDRRFQGFTKHCYTICHFHGRLSKCPLWHCTC